ncbi:condensation domain-containing protein [Chitinophaga sp.]|uniref:condensation domain-containing protein n=1 Tax=Chitinophaga sp. TaxID=1869181 RepID=UPI002F932EF9
MIETIDAQNLKVRWVGMPPTGKKKIALLIPQFNEQKNFELENRLRYFQRLALEYRDIMDVILIDDGSTDDSPNTINAFCEANPGCFYFAAVRPNAQKVGALYLVSLVIQHQYVILSDFDTDLVNLQALEQYLDHADEDDTVMGYYFRMIPFDGEGEPFLFQQLEYSFARTYYKFHKKDHSVPVMPGAGSCFKRDKLLQVYAMHSGHRNGEDREATAIGLKLGFKTIYTPDIMALTRPPQTFNALLIQRKRWYLGYVEAVYKERRFYTQALLKGRSIGWRTLQDALGVSLLLLLPLEIALLFLAGWKVAAGIIGATYLTSVLYYTGLFFGDAGERKEIKQKHTTLLMLYPLFWLGLSFLAWWRAFLAFKPAEFNTSSQTRAISSRDVLLHYDPATAIITEPFIGQAGYLKILNSQVPGDTFNETPFEDIHIFLESVDRIALEKTVAYFMQRHESLRTICPLVNGETKLVVLPYDAQTFAVNYMEAASAADYAAVKKHTFLEAAAKVADIGKGPLTYIFLFNVGKEGCNFHMLVHHLFKDKWSVKVINDELHAIYGAFARGQQPPLKPLTYQLRHYCDRENNWQTINAASIGAYWKNKLAGFYTLLDVVPYYEGFGRRNFGMFPKITEPSLLYNDQPSLKKILDRQDGAQCLFNIDSKRLQAIRELAHHNNSSVSAVMFATFYLLHYIYTGRHKTMLTIPIANRSVPGYRNIIGWLLGVVYLPCKISEMTLIDDLISQTFMDINDSIEHIIYEREMLGLSEDLLIISTDFCVNYMFTKEAAKLPYDGPGKVHLPDSNIWYGINCQLIESPEILSIKWQYNTHLFSEELTNDIIQCLEEILQFLSTSSNCTVKELESHMTASQQSLLVKQYSPLSENNLL